MWYVYFLEFANGDVYVGSTNDLKRRVASHQHGEVTSTRSLQPCSLKSYVAVRDEQTARSLERYFKSGSGNAFANTRFWWAILTEGRSPRRRDAKKLPQSRRPPASESRPFGRPAWVGCGRRLTSGDETFNDLQLLAAGSRVHRRAATGRPGVPA
jgi:predicted GIY-YIG superfamily endonuclease